MTIVFTAILVELFWFCAGSWISLDTTFRYVHVVLVSLLADQLAIFHLFGKPKKIGPSQRLDNFFYLLSWFFFQSRYSRGTNFQKRLDKEFKRVDKRNCLVSETGEFSFVWAKKVKLTVQLVGQRDWPKPHGRLSNLV